VRDDREGAAAGGFLAEGHAAGSIGITLY